MKPKHEIIETAPQTFTKGIFRCLLSIGENNTTLIAVDGVGSNYEIARANAYRKLAEKILEKIE